MQEIVTILKQLASAGDIENLQMNSNYKTFETTMSFYFCYVEFLSDEPFFLSILPNTKHISITGVGGDDGLGMMSLTFDGVLNKEIN